MIKLCMRLLGQYFTYLINQDFGEIIVNRCKVFEFSPLIINSSLKKRKDENFHFKDTLILQKPDILNKVMIRNF